MRWLDVGWVMYEKEDEVRVIMGLENFIRACVCTSIILLQLSQRSGISYACF